MKKVVILLFMALPIIGNAQNFDSKDKVEIEVTAALAALQASVSKTQSVSSIASEFALKIDTAKTEDAILKTQKSYIGDLYNCLDNPFLKNDIQFAEGGWKPSYIKYKPGNALIIGNILYASVFNNKLLDARERAKRIVENMADVLFLAVSDKVNTSIPYIGFCIGYGSKDFSKEYGMTYGDAMVVIAPVSAIKSYGDLSISEEQFVEKCDYYIMDKNFPQKLRKVDLNVFN